MNQLALNIHPRLLYSPENFVVHAGVKDIFAACNARLGKGAFSLFFVYGAKRCGKTHFCIKLSAELGKGNLHTRLIEGPRLSDWSQELAQYGPLQSDQVIVVDEADLYLQTLKPGDSGVLVNLIERVRLAQAGIVFLSARQIDGFSFDQHIQSRLNAGLPYEIGHPAEEDMPEIIKTMARQRGISLNLKKIEYLERRLGRDIAAIENYLDKLNHLSQVLGKSIQFPLLSDAI